MKTVKLTFDFSDVPQLAELLKIEAATSGKTQKALLVEALESYFSAKRENHLLWGAAERTFAEWDNPDDEIYDKL